MKKLGTLFLLLLLVFSLGAQSLSFSIKDQALQELNNIEEQNQRLSMIISDYEKNYQMLKLDYDSIKALTITQGESLLASNRALSNCEHSLKSFRIREYVYWAVLGVLVVIIVVN